MDEPAAPAESEDNPQLAYDLVDEFVALYMAEGTDAFEHIAAMSSNPDQPVVGFVVDTGSYTLVAHSSNPLYVGLPVTPVLAQAFIPIDVCWIFWQRRMRAFGSAIRRRIRGAIWRDMIVAG